MDDSDRKSNSSSSTSIKNRPSIPKSVDENGKSYKTKHFMSPTVSATSKFIPKKKVLGERNDSLDNQQKTPDLDSKSIHKGEFSTDSGESGGKSRPRFLRYNPNRRREILLRRESEEKEGGSDDVAPDSAVASVGGPLVQLEGGEIEESDDEFEEVEDERGWGFTGALKLVTLLVVLVLSTSYIVSMNDTTPSPVVEAVIGLRNGYQFVQDHVFDFVNQNLGLQMTNLEKSSDLVVEDEEETEFEGEISGFSNSEMTETVETAAAAAVEKEEDEIFEGVRVSIGDSTAAIEKGEEASIVEELIKDEIFEGVRVSTGDLTAAIEKEEEASIVQEIIKDAIFEGEMFSIGNSTDSHKTGDEPGNIEIKGFVKHLETESVLKAVIGLSVALSAVIASVVALTRKYRNTVNLRENNTLLPTPVDPKPCFESPVPEEEEHPIESAANFLISESLKDWNAKQERPQWSLSHESRAAPTIELLGEIEVAEMSTSLKSCSMKSNRAIDSEISSHFCSIKEKTTIFSTPLASSYPLDVQTPSSVLIPTVDYPSQSTEKKPRKNKASERADQSTPLRRSSRLRTRVTSP